MDDEPDRAYSRAPELQDLVALCRALGVRRYVYDDVIRRYRDEIGAGRWPRTGNRCDRVLTALTSAGDVRFASRWARKVA